MADALKAITGWFRALFSGGASSIDHWNVEYVRVDLDAVAEKLEVDVLGARNGGAGLPSPDSPEPDFPHKKIANHFSQLLADLYAKASARLVQYNAASGISELQVAAQSIDTTPDRFQRRVEQRIHEFNDALEEQKVAISKASDELDGFKKKNNIDREPRYPESLTIYIMIPLFLLALDVVFNAAVLKDASPQGEGLKGGILMAFLLALFNVILAASFGNGLRYLNCARPHYKVIGVLSGACLLMYVPFNLYVAHLRDRVLALKGQFDTMTFDEIVLQRQQILASTIDSMLQAPLSFSSIESIGLLVIGVAVALVSACDGYKSDDPVPGYKFFHQRLQRLKSGLAEMKTEFRLEVAQENNVAEEELHRDDADLQQTISKIRNFMNLGKRLVTVYAEQSADYVKSCDALITRYRDENRRARNGVAVPAYFNAPYPMPKRQQLEIPEELKGRDLAYYERMAADLQSHLDVARRDVHERWKVLQARVDKVIS